MYTGHLNTEQSVTEARALLTVSVLSHFVTHWHELLISGFEYLSCLSCMHFLPFEAKIVGRLFSIAGN